MNTNPMVSQLRGLSLRSLLPEATSVAGDDIRIRSCSGTWSDCQPGDLFVAVVEPDADGHEFAEQAVEKGAVAIVAERLLAVNCPQFLVDDSRRALGRICQALAGNPSDLLSTIGIAGSDGKTITSVLLDSILREAGGVPLTDNCLNRRPVARHKPDGSHTARLAQWMAHCVMEQASHAILEIDTRYLASHQLMGAAFDVMAITNIRRDEGGNYFSNEAYRAILARSLEFLKPHGVAIINADDHGSSRILDQLQVPALTIGMHQAAEVTARIVERSINETTFVLSAGNESCVVNAPMIGNHHVYNCLTAAAVALSMGIELPVIALGLERSGQIPGRMEPVGCGQDFNVFVDAAKRPSSIAHAIQAAKTHGNGTVHVLASVHDGQTPAERRRLGQVLERSAARVILAPLDNPSVVDYEPYHQILDGFDSPAKAHIVPNRFSAIETLLRQCPSGETAVILGGGERPVASVADGKWTVNDRDICEAWLFDRASLAKAIDNEPPIFRMDDYRKRQK